MIEKSMMIEPHVYSLLTIINDLKNGEIRVPPFQRDYVWTRDNIKELFDSIKKGYPIGSIIVWKPRNKMDWEENNKIGAFNVQSEEYDRNCYILDGYQRLSTLFCCFMNPEKNELTFDKALYSQLFELYYNLNDDCFEYLRAKTSPSCVQIPVHILLSTSDFRQYSRKFIEPKVSPDKLDLYLDRADSVSRQFVDYKLSVIEINNANIEDAVDIFSRINSKGTEITLDWMVNALSYRTRTFRFADIIDSLIESLREYNFEGINRNALFRCIQSSFGKLYIDQSDVEQLAKRDDFADVTLKTIPFIIQAVKFLYEELNVIDYKLLPYNIQLIFVMEFFRRLKDPSKKQIDDLKRWFWITSYSGYFTIYSLANQRKAYNQFVNYLNNKNSEILYSDNATIPFSVSGFPDEIRFGNVRSKVLVLFYLDRFSQKNNDGKRLCQIRLCSNLTPANNSAENFVFFGDEKLFSQLNKSNNSVAILKKNGLGNACFISDEFIESLGKGDFDSALKYRRNLIIKAEKEFVEKYALKYNV